MSIMHWLDSTPSREIDPVLDCLTFLARQADRPSSPVLLRAGLALSATGSLPFEGKTVYQLMAAIMNETPGPMPAPASSMARSDRAGCR